MKRIMLLLVLLAGCGASETASEQSAWPWPWPPKRPVPMPVPPPVPVPNPIPTATPVPPQPGPMPPAQSNWEVMHNDLRARHGVGPVRNSELLRAEAQAWADRCVFQHAQGTGHGENLAIGGGLTAERAMQLWYAEGNGYPYGTATPPTSYMHFTQIVWKGTAEVGCGTRACPQGTFHVCRYNPPGNFIGQFAQNVFPPR